MSSFTRFFDLPRELRDIVYEHCDPDDFIVTTKDSGVPTRMFYFSDTMRNLCCSSKQVRGEVLKSLRGSIPTLAIATDLSQLLKSKLIMCDKSEMILPHKIVTVIIPTKQSDASGEIMQAYMDHSAAELVKSSMSKGIPLKDLQVIALDDRLCLSPYDPDDSLGLDAFHANYYYASAIARAQGDHCMMYVQAASDYEDSLTFEDFEPTLRPRVVWQGRNSIPHYKRDSLSADRTTFLLDMTRFALVRLKPPSMAAQDLMDHVEDLCEYETETISDSKEDTYVLFQLFMDAEEEEAVELLSACKTNLEKLGSRSESGGRAHTVEVKVLGEYPVTPAGYRVIAATDG